jgi:hypothetical protein
LTADSSGTRLSLGQQPATVDQEEPAMTTQETEAEAAYRAGREWFKSAVVY